MNAGTDLEITPRSREVLAGLIGKLAHDKAALGRRYGEWAVSAPTLESGVAAAKMAQDELGHARSTFPLLKQLGVTDDGEDRVETHSGLAVLNAPLADWETFVAVNLVIDGYLTAFVEAARDSSFAPLAQRARKILQEERSHATHAAAWTRRLGIEQQSADRLLEAVLDSWSAVANWAQTEEDYALLVADGVLASSPGTIRATTQATITEAVAGTRLAVLWPS